MEADTMARGVGGRSPANIQKHLKGVDYPASKEQLVEAARRNQAPDEVVREIEELPGDRYGGPQDVMKAYGEIA
jgi:hypothetical protein